MGSSEFVARTSSGRNLKVRWFQRMGHKMLIWFSDDSGFLWIRLPFEWKQGNTQKMEMFCTTRSFVECVWCFVLFLNATVWVRNTTTTVILTGWNIKWLPSTNMIWPSFSLIGHFSAALFLVTHTGGEHIMRKFLSLVTRLPLSFPVSSIQQGDVFI